MKTPSSNLVHRFNNNILVIMTCLEAIEANIDDSEYVRNVFQEMIRKRPDIEQTVKDVRSFLEEKDSHAN